MKLKLKQLLLEEELSRVNISGDADVVDLTHGQLVDVYCATLKSNTHEPLLKTAVSEALELLNERSKIIRRKFL